MEENKTNNNMPSNEETNSENCHRDGKDANCFGRDAQDNTQDNANPMAPGAPLK